jgi:hypothetical protein
LILHSFTQTTTNQLTTIHSLNHFLRLIQLDSTLNLSTSITNYLLPPF